MNTYIFPEGEKPLHKSFVWISDICRAVREDTRNEVDTKISQHEHVWVSRSHISPSWVLPIDDITYILKKYVSDNEGIFFEFNDVNGEEICTQLSIK